MRRTAVLCALTGVAFASATVLACSDDGAPAHPPTSTSVRDPTPADALIEESQSIPSDPRISLKLVEGILPSPAATSATLGLAPGAWVLRADLGQEFEGIDIRRYGVTAGWVAFFRPALAPAAGALPEGMYLSLAFHSTSEDAERTYQYVSGVTGVQPGGESTGETIADAVSMMAGASTVSGIIIRQRTVTAAVVMVVGESRDASVGLRDFARMLALGIDEFVRSQGP